MKFLINIILLVVVFMIISASNPADRIRKPIDPVGFATRSWQMDSVMNRITRYQSVQMNTALNNSRMQKFNQWKVAICPHDDYTYVGWLYPTVLRNIKANTVLLIGVAHKAKKYNVENRMVFDSYDYWQEPYGPVKIDPLREAIMNKLPRSTYIVHDSLQQAEHSLEAIVPFLQYFNKNVRVVPILIPYMSFKTMKSLSSALAGALYDLSQDNNQDFKIGRDYAIVISTDAVHYGCEDWGGSDYAFYGCDTAGFKKAVDHEYEIIGNLPYWRNHRKENPGVHPIYHSGYKLPYL